MAISMQHTSAPGIRRLLFSGLLAMFASGCATLEPSDLAPESASAPAETALWGAVQEAAPADWHVLLNDGPTALDWRLRAIDSASQSIDFQTFLWHFDSVGAMVLDHVAKAADRGVRVRILIDDTFLVHEDSVLLALARHPNIEYRVFNPFKRRSGGLATRQLLNLADFGRLDHRMHNKAMVVDNRVAIVGGRNIADEYFGLDELANFRDLELLLGGSMVQEVSAAFDLYWNDRWSFPIEMLSQAEPSYVGLDKARTAAVPASRLHAEETAAQRQARWLETVADADTGETALYFDQPPEDNPKDRDEAPVQVANELVELFDAAESEIVIVSAYLIPTPHLEGAVERALGRGVRVRILTNSIRSNNHLAAHSAYRRHIDTLLGYGAELHEVRTDAKDRQQYMVRPVDRKMLALHAKALVIDDDEVFIGSANLDPRSLRINTEMGLLVRSERFNQSVRQALEGDFSAANAWRLELQEDASVLWIADDQQLASQPAASFMQRVEDWFLSHLPIEGEM
jgi:putative cardiolipin synthase